MATEKLKRLAELTRCSYTLEYNPHKGNYEGARDYISMAGVDVLSVGEFDYDKDFFEIQVYMNTPIMFFSAAANDLDALLVWAVDYLEDYRAYEEGMN